tara:strand:+ start:2807 stop:2908 length:102 start_codon:yes stop_codon:yes gene_type:complete
MINQILEISFWIILLTYFAARLAQTAKGYKQQH